MKDVAVLGEKALTDRQKRLVDALLIGKSDQEAGELAGYSDAQKLSNGLRSFAVQGALLEYRMGRLSGDMAKAALDQIHKLVTAPGTPASTRFTAAKWVMEQAGHTHGGPTDDRDVPLHEMSAEQLQQFMLRAQGVIDQGGGPPVITVAPKSGA